MSYPDHVSEIRTLLNELREFLPAGFNAEFKKIYGRGNFVRFGSNKVEYTTISAAARGIGGVLAGKSGEEQCVFKNFALMLDVSRNSVPTVKYLRKFFAQLALAGYNQVMLYAEDTYQLDGEPEFGAWRGGYSAAEIRELDDCASRLGIELIPCIQTLGHLGQLLKWHTSFLQYADTNDVMQVGKPETYKLIAKMLDFWSQNIRSRKVHLGMDETHGLGGGYYYAKHGPRDRFDIFNEHLAEVNKMCIERGLEPMIWGDMFFRIGSKSGTYGNLEAQFPSYAIDAYPKNVQIIAWNYYSYDEQFYRDFLNMHRNFYPEPIMAVGVYNSRIFWSNHTQSRRTITPAIEACKKENISSMIVTIWNDDGSVSPPESKMPGVFGTAELAWGGDDFTACRDRCETACGIDFERSMTAMDVEPYLDDPDGNPVHCFSMLLHWDDPLFAMTWHCYNAVLSDGAGQLAAHYAGVAKALADKKDHPYLVAKVLQDKMEFLQRLRSAYSKRDLDELRQLAEVVIPELIALNEELTESFRTFWLDAYKPFGLETMQIRQAGQIARLHEAKRRISDLLDGKIDCIEELDSTPESFAGYPYRYAYVAATGIL